MECALSEFGQAAAIADAFLYPLRPAIKVVPIKLDRKSLFRGRRIGCRSEGHLHWFWVRDHFLGNKRGEANSRVPKRYTQQNLWLVVEPIREPGKQILVRAIKEQWYGKSI